jgi:HEAT repeat protein
MGHGGEETARVATLADLERAFVAALPGSSDEARAERRRILRAIADLDVPMAQMSLRDLLVRHGGGSDRGRSLDILSALVRRGPAADVDHAIRWVERTRDPLLIESLSRVLAEAKRPATRTHLQEGALRRATPAIKAQIVRALGALGEPDAAFALLPLLREDNLRIRVETMGALGLLRDARALPMLRVFTRHQDMRLRRAAARALGLLENVEALPALHALLADPEPRVGEAAAQAIGLIGSSESVPILIDGLERALAQDLRVADAFASALHRISGKANGTDVELWRSWWETAKDKPFVRSDDPGPQGTVEGPNYYGFPVRSSYVVFVLDVSRSMGWNGRLESARKELETTIGKLPASTFFNILVYSDGVKRWKPQLVPAKLATKSSAITFIRNQRPDNGTNSHDALRAAFADQKVDTIFFLTDGHPTVGGLVDPDLILAAIRNWNRYRDVRIHTIALMRGAPPTAYAGREDPKRATRFMEELAQQNAGKYREVR